VRSTETEWADAIRWHLSPFLIKERGRRALEIRLYRTNDREPVYRYEGSEPRDWEILSAALLHALWDIHQLVPKAARDFLNLHAGGLVRDGGALVLPARPDIGKSTLTVALMRQGFDYLSDEVGAIDPITGRAYPFPKRVSLDHDSVRFFPEVEGRLADREGLTGRLAARFVRPEDAGSRIGRAAPVRWLVFPTADREGPPRLEPMARAEAVERMAENCFNLHRYGERGVILLARVAKDADAFRLLGGTPTERAALLAERLIA
jgi:hypothetical protein